MKKKTYYNKAWSTKNQYETSLGECSWNKILGMRECSEMFSFISRYLNSFCPFFQIAKHLYP